jgi:antibiotic biosynthesis monooxygenase (ABM) superfamily enzyme
MQNQITIAISHFVQQGKEQAFEEALKKVIQQAANFQGYEGIQVIQPSNKVENEYLLLVRFNNENNYQHWEASNIRKDWAEELKTYIHKTSQIRYQEGIEFWFSSPQISSPQPPIKWKMAILTWLAIYPLILLLSTIVGIYFSFLHPHIKMLVISMLLVCSMTYFIMPKITQLFAFWIFKE